MEHLCSARRCPVISRELHRVGLLLLGLLLAAPSPAHARDPGKYASIADDEPSPLPAGASDEDKRLLDELLRQRQLQLEALPGPPPGALFTPGEYEPVEGVLIRWGSFNSLLAEFVVGVTAASENLCTGSATPYACCTGSGAGTCDTPSTQVWISVENASTQASASATLANAGADMSRVEFIVYDSDTVWIRDYGPQYTFENYTRTIIDFTYARPTRPKDDAFNAFLAALWGEPIYDMGIVRAGGNTHVVSTGDAFVSSLALDPDEDGTNEYTEAEIEQVYQDYLGVDVTIYPRIPDSLDSTGHIDMWMLPLSDTDILVSQFPSGVAKTITDAAAVDLQARGYTVWRVPAAFSGGTHYTYTNAAIVNNKVFVPWYSGSSHSARNATALAVFQAAMPDHAVIQVDTSEIIGSSGAIHCVMKQVPAPIAAPEVPGVPLAGRLLLALLLVATGAYLARRRRLAFIVGLLAALLRPAPEAAAREIVRHCEGRYYMASTLLDGLPESSDRPRLYWNFGRFTGAGHCGAAVPDRCRERAKDKLVACFREHWKVRWDRVRPHACTEPGGVQGYAFSDIKSVMEEVVYCSEQSLPHADIVVNLYGFTSGDSGCGTDASRPLAIPDPAEFWHSWPVQADYEMACRELRKRFCPQYAPRRTKP
jgi:agmatine/peptidylarginine deiminase